MFRGWPSGHGRFRLNGQAELCGGGVGDVVARDEAFRFYVRRTLRRRAARLAVSDGLVVDADGSAVTAEIGKTVRMHKVSLLEP